MRVSESQRSVLGRLEWGQCLRPCSTPSACGNHQAMHFSGGGAPVPKRTFEALLKSGLVGPGGAFGEFVITRRGRAALGRGSNDNG